MLKPKSVIPGERDAKHRVREGNPDGYIFSIWNENSLFRSSDVSTWVPFPRARSWRARAGDDNHSLV